MFENYPQIFQQATDALFVALGNWTIEVWDGCAVARKGEGLPEQPEPAFVASIRRSRKPQTRNLCEESGQFDNLTGQTLGVDENPTIEYDSLQSYDFTNLLSFDLEPSEWQQWERLLTGRGI